MAAGTHTTVGGRARPSNSHSDGERGMDPTSLTTDDICGCPGCAANAYVREGYEAA